LVTNIGTTIYGVAGCQKHGASHGYTKVLGHHPLLATRADTSEVLHAQMHKGSGTAESGARRFIDELAARVAPSQHQSPAMGKPAHVADAFASQRRSNSLLPAHRPALPIGCSPRVSA